MLDLIRGKKTQDGSAEDGFAERKALSEFQNPFLRNRCSKVAIFIYNREIFHNNPGYAGQVDMTAIVQFKSGSTSGEQELKADTFEGLVQKINDFIKGLN